MLENRELNKKKTLCSYAFFFNSSRHQISGKETVKNNLKKNAPTSLRRSDIPWKV